jgi:hypothetical protein
LLVPAEDPERPQRVPPAGPTIAVVERELDFATMCVFQQPRTIGLLLGAEQLNGLVDPLVRRIAGLAEVFQANATRRSASGLEMRIAARTG